jgi:NitT/TauT family transport system substrate-binding protein
MTHARTLTLVIAATAALIVTAPADAADLLKLTVGQRGNWDTSIAYLGEKAGIFKKHGIDLEIIYTSGSGETLQPVIAGSVDLGFAVGTQGAMAAYAKGAPVRIIGAEATGAADYWYAKTSSPIKTLQDTNGHTIAFSTNGSSTQSIVRAFIDEFKLTAKPMATGNPSATLTSVMTGRRRLGLAPVRTQGTGGRPDPRGRQGHRLRAGPWSDHPGDRGQRAGAGKTQGRDRPLHAGLSRDDRLHVFR